MFNKIKFDNYQNLIQTIISRVNSELKQNTQNMKLYKGDNWINKYM